MLVLARKVGEVIRIGDDIEIRVNRLKGNCVSLGLTAPNEISIVRDELCFEPPPDVSQDEAKLVTASFQN